MRPRLLMSLTALSLCGVVAGWSNPAPAQGSTTATKAPAAPPLPALPAPRAAEGLMLAITATPDRGTLIAVGEHGQILRSANAGTVQNTGGAPDRTQDWKPVWKQASVPVQATLTAVTFVSARRGFAVGHDGVILQTEDEGATWQIQRFAPDENRPLLTVYCLSETHCLAAGAYGLFLETRNGGGSWEERPPSEDELHFNTIVPGAAPGTLFVAGEAGTLFRSRDGGQSWDALDVPYRGSLFAAVAFGDAARGEDGLLVAGLRGTVLRSTDGGDSWTQIAVPTTAGLFAATRSPGGDLVLAGGLGVELVSRDQGQSFDLVARPDLRALSGLIALPDGGFLGVGDGGIRRLKTVGSR